MGRLILSALAAVALAGCGADEKSRTAAGPATATSMASASDRPAARDVLRPAEPAETAVARLARAARAGDCSHPGLLVGTGRGVPLRPACQRLVDSIDVATPPDVKTYGSAAVAKNADAGASIFALDTDRRFKFVVAFSGPHLPRAPMKNVEETMSRAVGAIRRDNCGDLTPWVFGGGKPFCALEPIRQLHAALDRSYTASPKPLGGDGTFAFYGLRIKPHYFTLVFLAAKNGSWYFVTSVRA